MKRLGKGCNGEDAREGKAFKSRLLPGLKKVNTADYPRIMSSQFYEERAITWDLHLWNDQVYAMIGSKG